MRKTKDNEVLEAMRLLAMYYFDGHFTIMRFSTKWRVAFGEQPQNRKAIDEMAEGNTLLEAFAELLDRTFSGKKRGNCMKKRNYNGLFIFPHTIKILYAYALSPQAAKHKMIRRMALADGVSVRELQELFKDGNFTVKEEVNDKRSAKKGSD